MAWSSRQKQLVHEYARFAGLDDSGYRVMLFRTTGAVTSVEPALDQAQWEDLMTNLEEMLEAAVRAGAVRVPARRKVANLAYWRTRFPEASRMTSRQRYLIQGLWAELQPYLEEAKRTDRYLAGIVSASVGYRVGDVWDLPRWMAARLIDALRDRLRYARRGTQAAGVVQDGCGVPASAVN